MRAKSCSLNHCAVPFLSRAAVNLSRYNSNIISTELHCYNKEYGADEFTLDVFTLDVFTLDEFTLDVFTLDVFTLDVFTNEC